MIPQDIPTLLSLLVNFEIYSANCKANVFFLVSYIRRYLQILL